jgi:hypothetical protein
MTSIEINSEIAKNIEAIADATKKSAEYDKGAKEYADWYRRLQKKRPDVKQTAENYARQKEVEDEKISNLKKRNIVLNEQLDSLLATATILAKQGKTIESVEKEAKAVADATKIKAENEAKIEKEKADLDLSIKVAKENEPKGMNPILKISLISLGVAGALIGGYLLVKKMKK